MRDMEEEWNKAHERASSLIDEDLQTVLDEFEALYCTEDAASLKEMEKEEKEAATEEMEFISHKKPVYIEEPIRIRDSSGQEKKGRKGAVLAVLGLVAVVGIGFAVYGVVSERKFRGGEHTKPVAADVNTEAPTTEEATEDYWFADKVLCEPVKTEKTISLPSADLSIFEVAEAQDENAEDKIDPWLAVTLNLDSVPGSINLTSPGQPETTTQMTSTYMVLVDVDTNEIIAERDCEKIIVPASMTKILTVITAREYIDETKLDDTYTITADIVNEAQASGLSAVGFLPGDSVTVRDMLYGTIVCSGADAAMGLAEYCAGSQEAFVEQMNENVARMGLSDTAHFTNVVGKYDDDLYCTMTDMATILSVAMQDDLLRDVMSKKIYRTDVAYPDLDMPEGMELSNWFLRRIEDQEFAGEVIGAKTGFVNQSGFCSASYYEASDGKRYICVTGNANNTWRAIYDHTAVYRSFTPGTVVQEDTQSDSLQEGESRQPEAEQPEEENEAEHVEADNVETEQEGGQ